MTAQRWQRGMHGLAAVGVGCILAGLALAQSPPPDGGATSISAPPAGGAAPLLPPPMRAERVAPDTYLVQGQAAMGTPANRNFISNAGFVVADGGVLVIDALGSPALAQQMLALIRTITPLPLRALVVTHCHADHIYGLQVWQAAGAAIVGHVGCRDYLQSDAAQQRLQASRHELAPWIDAQTRLVAPTQWLGEAGDNTDLRLQIGRSEFIVRPAGPAHTAEDLIVYAPGSGTVFVGDLVFRGRIPFVGQADSRRWITALERILALQPRVLIPGHGPASFDAARDVALTLDYLRHLRQTMGAAAAAMEPFDEAFARTDWSAFAGLPLFGAIHRMNAYNTYLLMEHADAPPPPR